MELHVVLLILGVLTCIAAELNAPEEFPSEYDGNQGYGNGFDRRKFVYPDAELRRSMEADYFDSPMTSPDSPMTYPDFTPTVSSSDSVNPRDMQRSGYLDEPSGDLDFALDDENDQGIGYAMEDLDAMERNGEPTLMLSKRLVGSWWLSYTNGYKDEYTITEAGKIIIKSRQQRNVRITASDNQALFPTSEGWMKVEKVYRDRTWEYIRVKIDGTLEIIHFCSDGCGRHYKGLGSYCCIGTGLKKGFVSVGCYRDSQPRAVGGPFVIFQTDTIRSCYVKALAAGNEYFAVQKNTLCFTSSDAGETYATYGPTTGCKNGKGAWLRNDVYRITGLVAPKVSLEVFGEEFRLKCEVSLTGEARRTYEVFWYAIIDGKEVEMARHVLKNTNTSVLDNNDADPSFYIGNTVFAKLRTWLPGQDKSRQARRSSNKYFLGFKFDPVKLSLSESGKPVNLKVISTVPIICEDGSSNCNVTVNLIPSQPDILLSKCTLVFTATNSFPVAQTVAVSAKRDFVDNGDRKLKLSAVINYLPVVTFASVWFKPVNPRTVEIATESVSGGQCTSTGDPHVRTFDNAFYNHYRVGDYTLVDSTARTFEVQVRTHPCASVACNCGVAVRDGEDILVVDMCRTRFSPEPRYARNQEPVRGTYIERSANGKTFILKFASGAIVKYVAKHWYGSNYYADITVQVPPDDFGKTKGLCGVLDKNRGNDMTSKDGKVWANCGSHACPGFTESWKVPQSRSLFNMYPTGKLTCRSTVESRHCMCGGSQAVCDIPIVPPLLKSTTKGYTKLLFSGEAECDLLRKENGSGKKPEPNKPVTGPSEPKAVVLPPCISNCTYPYVPPTTKPRIPSWPTAGGIDETNAKVRCEKGMKETQLYAVCETYVARTIITGFIDQCIADIQILDKKGVTTAIESANSALKDVCEDHVTKNPANWKKDKNGKMVPPTGVIGVLCPNLCSRNGVCKNGTCACNQGYLMDDCSVKEGQKPYLTMIKGGDICKGAGKACSSVRIISRGLIPGNIQCHLQLGDEQTVTVRAELISFSEVLCQVPDGLIDSVRYSDVTYKIRLSNGDVRSENQLNYRMVDLKCNHCDGSMCTHKASSCVVNNYCYGADEVDPYDPVCSFCNPTERKDGFSKRRNAECFVHPCDLNNGDCQDKCNRLGEKATCACTKTGMKLAADGLTCIVNIGCPKIVCKIHCEFGYGTDRYGCALCRCRRPLPGPVRKFKVHLSVSYSVKDGYEVKSAPRLFIQLLINPKYRQKRIVPENCFASPSMDRFDPYRIYLIRERSPAVRSYVQHSLSARLFRFSVSPFAVSKKRTRPTYLHCNVRVCHSYSRRCAFSQRELPKRISEVTYDDGEQGREDEVPDQLVHTMARLEPWA